MRGLKTVLVGTIAAASLAVAGGAQAAITISSGSFGGSGVHSTPGLSASTVTGTVGSDLVTLNSVGAIDIIDTSGGGESTFAAHDGSLQGITVAFTNYYDQVTFDLFKPQGESSTSNWTLSVNGTALALGAFNPLSGNTSKFIVSGNGVGIHSLAFTFSPGIQDIREIRVGELVAPPGGVPEPATWGLMILGLGGVGATLRSRRRLAVA